MDAMFRNNPAAFLALLQSIGVQPAAASPSPHERRAPKACQARSMMRDDPAKWFRDAVTNDRDLVLLARERAPFIEYGQSSYVRKIFHMKRGEQFQQTEWTVEADDDCKNLVWSAGGQLHGFDFESPAPVNWTSVTVNVNIQGASNADFNWGYLSTRPSNIRIFKGPPETCAEHPWDAMILRDCTPNTTSLYDIHSIASRKWDILAMKMCEDYDHPWVVVSVKDAGPFEPNMTGKCDCQDPTACGCIICDVHA